MSEKPENTHMGLTFKPIPQFSDNEVVWGAPASAYFDRHNLPHVPEKYKDMAMTLFFKGGKLKFKEVNKELAYRAIKAWLVSFNPSHESKEATVGYALWLWEAELE